MIILSSWIVTRIQRIRDAPYIPSPICCRCLGVPWFPAHSLPPTENIEYNCHIFRRFEYIYTDIPRRGIEFIESTYSSDIFLGQSFRHAIGPSEGMWPDHWMRKRVRLRRQAPTPSTDGPKDDEDHSIFKRKNLEPNFDMEDLQWKRDASPRVDL